MTPRERERLQLRETWDQGVDHMVAHMIGPAVGQHGRDEQRDYALHLAAAALRFAGQDDLAVKVEALAR